jgi:mRNA-degrading endonuclease RelE of RelBE toxin-antitoxin system
MIYDCLEEFNKDLRRLLKRFRSLDDDLEVLKKYLDISPSATPPVSFLMNNLGLQQEIIKVKKFACKALKGKGANSGIRVIYAFHKEEQKIVFIEIYFKGDQENEDRNRIRKYYSR